jgi:hypothetical protein
VLLSEETSTVCSDIQTSKAFLEIQNLPGSVRGKVSTITFQFKKLSHPDICADVGWLPDNFLSTLRPILRVNGRNGPTGPRGIWGARPEACWRRGRYERDVVGR